ncbi:MAG: UvrD-helicase domain-containing protein, partial [Desulfosarcinaceae bacterium]
DTELSYQAIFAALTDRGDGRFKGTIEFYPEEGKYHLDGHRKCGVQLTPGETRIYDGICPVCGKGLVLGVLHRVEALADRPLGFKPASGDDYVHLVPLEDILAQLLRVGPKSKKVIAAQDRLLDTLGPELGILRDLPLEALTASEIPHLGEAIRRMRSREIRFSPGYDGEYGRLQLFSPDEWQDLGGQRRLFDIAESFTMDSFDAAPVQSQAAKRQAGVGVRTNDGGDNVVSRVLQALDKASDTGGDATAVGTIKLNAEQQQVVDHDGGPLIVVAGPGTGKTRVLTERIVQLVNSGQVSGERILAVTFTQKAAAEMNERLQGRLTTETQTPLVATFHSLCLQLLKEGDPRPEAAATAALSEEAAPKERSIVGGERQLALVADALKLAAITARAATEKTAAEKAAGMKPKAAREAISAVKQVLLPPEAPREDLVAATGGLDIAAVYATYQRLLDNQRAWDYDDLIFQVVTRLEEDHAYRDACRERFTHLFVDEYQDLNASQYRIVKALCPPGSQLCVIGDPDQAIYGFRGARMAYFNNFLEDYPDARVVHLRRNYRSVQTILTAAFGVIRDQHINLLGAGDDRPLAQIPGSPRISALTAATERSEAVGIGKTIEQMVGGTGFHHLDFGSVKDQVAARHLSFGDFAVLYRTHPQGQKLAEQLGKGGIPCQVCSRRQILGHPAIKALTAVVQLMNNSASFSDFEIAADAFKAGIGPKTLEQLKRWAYHKGLGLMGALTAARRVPLPGITLARQHNLFDLIKRLDRLHDHLDPLPLTDQLRYLVGQTPIGALFNEDEAATHALAVLMRRSTLAAPNRGTFLENLSLLSDSDAYDPRAERVTLMTLHAAKGLEFPVVFIAGCENGFLPYLRNPGKETADIDEERRLLYVGMTRARYQLFLSCAQKRRIYGKVQARDPSPFLAAIEKDLLAPWEQQAPKKAPPRQRQLGLFE